MILFELCSIDEKNGVQNHHLVVKVKWKYWISVESCRYAIPNLNDKEMQFNFFLLFS